MSLDLLAMHWKELRTADIPALLTLAQSKSWAIGWALRDYARHDPADVAAFLATNKTRLSPLSYREADKHLSSAEK